MPRENFGIKDACSVYVIVLEQFRH